jgi:chromosome segregation ATPase
VKAGDVEYRARLISAAEQQKCALATKADELKLVSRDLRETRSEVQTLRTAIRKLESAKIKLSTSIKGKEASAYQSASEIVLLGNKIKRLNADVKILTKKIDGQLQLKLLQAVQQKSRLALEKEKLGLQRDEGKKRKKREMIELEH